MKQQYVLKIGSPGAVHDVVIKYTGRAQYEHWIDGEFVSTVPTLEIAKAGVMLMVEGFADRGFDDQVVAHAIKVMEAS